VVTKLRRSGEVQLALSECSTNSELSYTHLVKKKCAAGPRIVKVSSLLLRRRRIKLLALARRFVSGYYSNRSLERERQNALGGELDVWLLACRLDPASRASARN
jgi:hypothetical protein